jgi:hypothetical protein
MGKKKELMNTVTRRKLEYLGHIMYSDTNEECLGERGPGRRRIAGL